MHVWMDGWDWFWMSLVMIGWIIALGAVVYVAARRSQKPPSGGQTL